MNSRGSRMLDKEFEGMLKMESDTCTLPGILRFRNSSLESEFMDYFYGKGFYWRGIAATATNIGIWSMFLVSLEYSIFLIIGGVIVIILSCCGCTCFCCPCMMKVPYVREFMVFIVLFPTVCYNAAYIGTERGTEYPFSLLCISVTIVFELAMIVVLRPRIILLLPLIIVDATAASIIILVYSVEQYSYRVLVTICIFYFNALNIYLFCYVLELNIRKVFLTLQELKIQERRIRIENEMTHHLLHNVLPESFINDIKSGKLDRCDNCLIETCHYGSLLECDLIDFTIWTSKVPTITITSILNKYFSFFDTICEMLGLEKLKTCGDSFICFSTMIEDSTSILKLGICIVESVKIVNLIFNEKFERFTQLQRNKVMEFGSTSILQERNNVTSNETKESTNIANRTIRVGIVSGNYLMCVTGGKQQRLNLDLFGPLIDQVIMIESKAPSNSVCVDSETYHNTREFIKYRRHYRAREDSIEDLLGGSSLNSSLSSLNGEPDQQLLHVFDSIDHFKSEEDKKHIKYLIRFCCDLFFEGSSDFSDFSVESNEMKRKKSKRKNNSFISISKKRTKKIIPIEKQKQKEEEEEMNEHGNEMDLYELNSSTEIITITNTNHDNNNNNNNNNEEEFEEEIIINDKESVLGLLEEWDYQNYEWKEQNETPLSLLYRKSVKKIVQDEKTNWISKIFGCFCCCYRIKNCCRLLNCFSLCRCCYRCVIPNSGLCRPFLFFINICDEFESYSKQFYSMKEFNALFWLWPVLMNLMIIMFFLMMGQFEIFTEFRLFTVFLYINMFVQLLSTILNVSFLCCHVCTSPNYLRKTWAWLKKLVCCGRGEGMKGGLSSLFSSSDSSIVIKSEERQHVWCFRSLHYVLYMSISILNLLLLRFEVFGLLYLKPEESWLELHDFLILCLLNIIVWENSVPTFFKYLIFFLLDLPLLLVYTIIVRLLAKPEDQIGQNAFQLELQYFGVSCIAHFYASVIKEIGTKLPFENRKMKIKKYKELEREKKKNEVLLHSVLPKRIVDEIYYSGFRSFSVKLNHTIIVFIRLNSKRKFDSLDIQEKSLREFIKFLTKLFNQFDCIVEGNPNSMTIKRIQNTYLFITRIPEQPQKRKKKRKTRSEVFEKLVEEENINNMMKEYDENDNNNYKKYYDRINKNGSMRKRIIIELIRTLRVIRSCVNTFQILRGQTNQKNHSAMNMISTENIISTEMNIGLSIGDVGSGVLGVEKFLYDIFGFYVNLSSRLANCDIGKSKCRDGKIIVETENILSKCSVLPKEQKNNNSNGDNNNYMDDDVNGIFWDNIMLQSVGDVLIKGTGEINCSIISLREEKEDDDDVENLYYVQQE